MVLSSEKKSFNICLFILVITLGFLYLQSFSFELIYFDDNILIETYKDLADEEKIFSAFNSNYLFGHYYRPITTLTLIIDSLFNRAEIFHVTNFLIHLITCWLIFNFLQRENSPVVSLFATMLFGLNAIHTNAVGWIAGRGDLLSALFSIVGLTLLSKYFLSEKFKYFIFSIFFLALAILSKESALFVSILFLFLIFMNTKHEKKNNGYIFSFIAVIPLVYLLVRKFLSPQVNIDKFSIEYAAMNWFIPFETIGKYFTQINIHSLNSFSTFSTISGVVIALVLVSLPLLLKEISKKNYYFGVVWFFLLFLPSMSFRTLSNEEFYYWDSRSYLPLVGLTFSIAEIFKQIEKHSRRKLFFSIVTIVLIYMGVTTNLKLINYKDAVHFWNSVRAEHPQSTLSYVGLYNYYRAEKKYELAEEQLRSAIELKPEEITNKRMLLDFHLYKGEKSKSFQMLKELIYEDKFSEPYYLKLFIDHSIELHEIDELEFLIERIELNDEMKNKIEVYLNSLE